MVLKPRTAVVYVALCVILSCSPVSAERPGHTWYVDCAGSNSSGDGLSQSTAWKSVHAVSEHVFQPGDSILFRRGSVCHGMLAPKGSGSAGAYIRLGAWNVGPLPRIEAVQGDEAALKLFGQEYWRIENLEFSGGNPHGVFVSGTTGILHGIHIKNVIVHDVTGQPKTKEDGLLVIASGADEQHFDDVLIDGVTAYHTSQWAGILVGGVAHGYPPETSRNTNIVIRNSIAHDVVGDGIILFEVNHGQIENSIAWRTGMQDTETIGTPNAIWTWMCRDCTVRHNEAFLTDSPGVDGGAFDIDYGNDNNIVEENFGHDTQGYCVAVFAAGWVTGNSIVRNNVCAANGLSPRLARRQGAIFLSTWNAGKIRGLQITDNRIFWSPPLTTPAIVNVAEVDGKPEIERNTVKSEPLCKIREKAVASAGKWRLSAFVSGLDEDRASRGMVAALESVHAQFPDIQMKIVVNRQNVLNGDDRENLPYNWNTRDIPVLFDDTEGPYPVTTLVNPSGKAVWRHEGLAPPGDLGLLLRSFLNPDYAKMPSDR